MRRARLAAASLLLATGCARIVVLNDPLTAAEHNDLGVVYESKQEPALAEREYRRALRKDPRYATARVNLGNLSAAAGRWSAAERCYRVALAGRPGDLDAMNNLAVALLRQRKKLEEAEILARRALAAAPKDSAYAATLAEVIAARAR